MSPFQIMLAKFELGGHKRIVFSKNAEVSIKIEKSEELNRDQVNKMISSNQTMNNPVRLRPIRKSHPRKSNNILLQAIQATSRVLRLKMTGSRKAM